MAPGKMSKQLLPSAQRESAFLRELQECHAIVKVMAQENEVITFSLALHSSDLSIRLILARARISGMGSLDDISHYEVFKERFGRQAAVEVRRHLAAHHSPYLIALVRVRSIGGRDDR
jgi:hypothetical protein